MVVVWFWYIFGTDSMVYNCGSGLIVVYIFDTGDFRVIVWECVLRSLIPSRWNGVWCQLQAICQHLKVKHSMAFKITAVCQLVSLLGFFFCC